MIDIHPMRAQELDAVSALESAVFSTPWTREEFAAELTSEFAFYFTAHEDGVFLGYVGCRMICGAGDITTTAVMPAARRRGVGRALFQALFAALAHAGCASLFLEVRASNAPARALYHSLGFEEISVRRDYYDRPREDAVIMRRLFPSPACSNCSNDFHPGGDIA